MKYNKINPDIDIINNNSNIMDKTFEYHHNKNLILDNNESSKNYMELNNENDIKAQTLSLFGLNKDFINNNNLLEMNNKSINSKMILRQPKFELENIYRDRLLSLYKDKSKEELLNYFIESEINNVLLRKEIEKNKLNEVKYKNKIIDLKQENIVLKTKIKNFEINDNGNENINLNINSNNKIINDENNLSLPNSSFVQKELNIKNEFNNMDIDSLFINGNNI